MFVLQEFDVVAMLHVLSSLLTANVTDAAAHFSSDMSSAVLTSVLDLIDSACVSRDVQHTSSLMLSTSMWYLCTQ